MSTVVALVVAVALIALDIPIGLAFLSGSLLALATLGGPGALQFAPATILNSLTSLAFLAVPMFIFASDLLLGSGIGEALTRLLTRATFGRRRLSPVAAVAAAVFFGGISGSSVAEAAALGRLVYPMMRKQGFGASKIAGLLAAAATVGVLLPPSIPLIVFGGVTQTSVTALFRGALWPGIVTAVVLALVGVITIRPDRSPATLAAADPTTPPGEPDAVPLVIQDPRASMGEIRGRVRSVIAPIFALMAPVIAVGGIYSGVVTPTEAGALLVLYGILSAGIFQSRRFVGVVSSAAMSALKTSSSIFLILAGALLFSQIATQDEIPQRLSNYVLNAGMPAKPFLVVLALIVVVFGVLFEGLGMLLVMAPIVSTIASGLHLDLVYFGVFLVVCTEISVIAPPLGINLLTVSSVTGLKLSQVSRSVMRFFAVPIVLLVVIIVLPNVIRR